jgi:hypothetical protein
MAKNKSCFLTANPRMIQIEADSIRRMANRDYMLGLISEDEYKKECERSKFYMDYAYVQNII